MGSLAALLMSLIGPMAVRALITLGIGTVTFTGVTVALNGLINMAVDHWANLPTSVLALCSLAGVPQALGIVAGAMVARVGMWYAISAVRWVKG